MKCSIPAIGNNPFYFMKMRGYLFSDIINSGSWLIEMAVLSVLQKIILQCFRCTLWCTVLVNNEEKFSMHVLAQMRKEGIICHNAL